MGHKLWAKIKGWAGFFGDLQRERALALTRLECAELENIFALLLVGSFIGLPAPPSFLALDLMPMMEKEIQVFHRRACDSDDMLSQLLGVLGVD
ncbi:MAG TPA: hypothetical protein PLT64_06305 [Syntrophales bacterium]|nr:hypothetical protein [Syntrophales bacterium]HOL59467.1 hypothetical protein [Syntrophales bacterium]HPO34649.1 hypothetical protein [Syntrophales bacterium]